MTTAANGPCATVFKNAESDRRKTASPAWRRASTWIVGFSLTAAVAAQPKSDREIVHRMDIRTLKCTYLNCEREAGLRLLDGTEAARCSVIYETLKERGFSNDYRRLHAWWREQMQRDAAGPARSAKAASACQ